MTIEYSRPNNKQDFRGVPPVVVTFTNCNRSIIATRGTKQKCRLFLLAAFLFNSLTCSAIQLGFSPLHEPPAKVIRTLNLLTFDLFYGKRSRSDCSVLFAVILFNAFSSIAVFAKSPLIPDAVMSPTSTVTITETSTAEPTISPTQTETPLPGIGQPYLLTRQFPR